MHAMSALYHIAQNDPPALSTDGWYVLLHDNDVLQAIFLEILSSQAGLESTTF